MSALVNCFREYKKNINTSLVWKGVCTVADIKREVSEIRKQRAYIQESWSRAVARMNELETV